ncbi:MAG: ACT domain-containing protein [Clostridia bacterium]|nr:ACT domain-containing protein [Clostridia bacterium]
MKKTVITIIGKDNYGIIAAASAICAENKVNIIDITQSVLDDMFVMVMLADISAATCPFGEFSDKMRAFGTERGLDVRVMHEDIFNSMHRI